MPNCNWPNYVYEFVEIKENIIPKSLSISLCQITQQIYIDQYKKIGCVTGTLGSKADEQILKEYNVKSFKVPRNIPSKVEIYYKNRPRSIDDIFNTVYQEIVDIKNESRPVLIIWDSKENSENFKEFLGLKEIEPVIQLGFDTDENILNTIGQSSNILNTTSFEVRKIVIKLSEQLINAGGLHVIIPMKITNLSLLEQAVGKAGRDGQKGSVTILIDKNDLFIDAPLYNHKNKNLQKLEIEFSKYIITNFPWMISGKKNNNFDDKLVFPFLANYSDIFNILSRKIFLIFKNETKKSIKTDEKVSNKFQDLAWKMVQTAWGVFFTKMKNDTFNNDSSFYCDKSYNRFIKELNKFLDSTEITSIYSAFKFIKSLYENDIYNESIIYNDYEVSSSNFDIISTNKTNQSIINLEMIPNSKNGPTLDWIVDTIEQLHNYIEDSKKNLPNMQVLAKTPKVELPNVDISLIKLELKFASEAYNGGHFSIGKVIFSSETNDLFKPVFYCIEHQNKLFVATRGSDSKFDWMTDFTCYEVIKEINGSDVYFHKGFLAAASYILSLISEFMQRDYSEIYFVGHSYAAAVSNVLCMLSKAHEKFKDKKIFSFAFAPPPSVSKIPGCIQECMFSFINKYDIVPHLSLRNIQNTINLQKIPVDVYLNKAKFILRSFNSDYSNTFADLIEQYEDELSKSLNSAKNDLHVHKNIGNLFYIGLTESRKLKNCQIDETDLTNIVFFSPSMLKHHKVTEYIDSLAKINTY